MNTLTSEMTRLRGEMVALRAGRSALIRQTGESNVRLRGDVSGLLEQYHRARTDMAESMRAQLTEFTGRIKDSVTELRHGVRKFLTGLRKDLAGARSARKHHAPMAHGIPLGGRSFPVAAPSPVLPKVRSAARKPASAPHSVHKPSPAPGPVFVKEVPEVREVAAEPVPIPAVPPMPEAVPVAEVPSAPESVLVPEPSPAPEPEMAKEPEAVPAPVAETPQEAPVAETIQSSTPAEGVEPSGPSATVPPRVRSPGKRSRKNPEKVVFAAPSEKRPRNPGKGRTSASRHTVGQK